MYSRRSTSGQNIIGKHVTKVHTLQLFFSKSINREDILNTRAYERLVFLKK